MARQIVDPQNVWLTSDLHFFHKNIMKYVESRGAVFSSVDEMNAGIIEAINRDVGPNGELYHLGDLSFGRIDPTISLLKRLNIKHLHLIFGNHDNPGVMRAISSAVNYHFGREVIVPHGERMYIQTKHAYCVLDHYPGQVWKDSHKGSIQFHGHTHGSLSNEGYGRRADVGWDSPHFGEPNRLFRLDQAIQHMLSRKVAIHDHHETR